MRFNAIVDRDCGLRTIKEREKDSLGGSTPEE